MSYRVIATLGSNLGFQLCLKSCLQVGPRSCSIMEVWSPTQPCSHQPSHRLIISLNLWKQGTRDFVGVLRGSKRFWSVIGGCLKGCGGCVEGVWRVSGGYLKGVWRLLGGRLEGFWKVSDLCLLGMKRVSGIYKKGSRDLVWVCTSTQHLAGWWGCTASTWWCCAS